MAFDVGSALVGERADALRVDNELLKFAVYVIGIGQHVDDWAQVVFAENLVVFFFAAADNDKPLSHSQQSVHCRRVGVELVKDYVARVHHVLILLEWNRHGFDNLAAVGVSLVQLLEGGEHYVGAFVFAALLRNADEEAHGPVDRRGNAFDGIDVDGEGDELQFVVVEALVASVVFVESGDYAVAIVGNVAIGSFFVGTDPVVDFAHGDFVGAKGVAEVEVGVAQRALLPTFVDPKEVHPESPEDGFPIMPFEILVGYEVFSGIDLEKHWVDELNDVVAAHPSQSESQPSVEVDCAER